ncbi:MAG: helix-turn-helix transcriptional regulator [Pseudobacteriovorax sp.]|nr:helix-turn-helix transcriptional regulator [Pseudobacteriovorax sp.]
MADQVDRILSILKRIIKSRGKTYRDIAEGLGISESSVKRVFSHQTFSLARMEEVCNLIGISIYEVCRIAESIPGQSVSHLPYELEDILIKDVKFATLTYLLINEWQVKQILADYRFTKEEVQGYLKILEDYQILERHPNFRIRMLVPRSVSWIPEGPLENHFRDWVKKEFLNDAFQDEMSLFRFSSGELSERSQKILHRKIKETIDLFDELASFDASLDRSETESVGMITAIRPWSLPAFEALKRNSTLKENT